MSTAGVEAFAPEPLVTRHPVIDEVLGRFEQELGRDAPGYRGHVYRVFNLARALAGTAARDGEIAVAAVFHDLGIWSDGTFDYLGPSAERAVRYLEEAGRGPEVGEVDRMIAFHHAIKSCREVAGPVAEAFRRADLVDVSLGAVRFGLPRAFVRGVRESFPNAGFHRCLLRVASGWIARHPLRPAPMMRW